MVELVETPGR